MENLDFLSALSSHKNHNHQLRPTKLIENCLRIQNTGPTNPIVPIATLSQSPGYKIPDPPPSFARATATYQTPKKTLSYTPPNHYPPASNRGKNDDRPFPQPTHNHPHEPDSATPLPFPHPLKPVAAMTAGHRSSNLRRRSPLAVPWRKQLQSRQNITDFQ